MKGVERTVISQKILEVFRKIYPHCASDVLVMCTALIKASKTSWATGGSWLPYHKEDVD
jgi:hypothetical protein